MSEGVEWAIHACIVLDWLGDGQPVPTARLAEVFDLSPAYLNKHLQALVRGGVLRSKAGARGGFSLADDAERITLLDVVTAIEGPDDAFRCQEIRQRGLGARTPKREFGAQCAVAAAMRSADVAWREALASQSLRSVRDATDRTAPKAAPAVRRWHAGVA